MKYTTEITINLPIDRVIKLFDNFENLYKWQPTLKSQTHLEGEPGQTGAKTLLVYVERGRSMEMIEEIISRNFPDDSSAIYTARGVVNIHKNKFEEISPEKTRYTTITEFKFSGIMTILSLFMRRAFPKQTLMRMHMFRKFAENNP
jgi:hypothetical protein